MGFNGIYPLVMTNIAIENGHRNSEFSHQKMVIFHSYVSSHKMGQLPTPEKRGGKNVQKIQRKTLRRFTVPLGICLDLPPTNGLGIRLCPWQACARHAADGLFQVKIFRISVLGRNHGRWTLINYGILYL